MECLEMQAGDFTGLEWRADETAVANGATITNNNGYPGGVSVRKGGVTVSLENLHANTTCFIIFGNNKYVLISRLDPGSNGVNLVEITDTTVIGHNLQISNMTQIPIVSQSRGNGSLFFIRYSYGPSNFVAGFICKSYNGVKIDSAFFSQHDPATTFIARVSTGTMRPEILANGAVIAAGIPPVGKPRLSTNSLNFGSVTVGASKQLEFTLKNEGQNCMKLNSLTARPAFTFVVPPLPNLTIFPEGNNVQQLTVRFSPTEIKTYNAGEDLHVSTTPALSNDIVHCRGTGVAPTIQTSGLTDYGRIPVNTVVADYFKIKNTSPVPILFSIAASPAGNAFEWQAASGQLAPNATSIGYPVSFSPTATIAYTANLELRYYPASVPAAITSRTIHYSGHGCMPSFELSVEPGSLDFGMVSLNSFRELPLTLKNDGNLSLKCGAKILPLIPGNSKSEAQAAIFSLYPDYLLIRDRTKKPGKVLNGITINPRVACGEQPEGTGELHIGVVVAAFPAIPMKGNCQAILEIVQENGMQQFSFSIPIAATLS